jgi:Zn-dependent M28 family amino/carboxypeptidase
MKHRAALVTTFALFAAACSSDSGSRSDGRATGTARIDENDLLAHVVELSSDRYEGRGPGTPGEELTIAYLTQQFRAIGLQPGNPDGTFVQRVPLVGFKTQPQATFATPQGAMQLAFPTDYIAVPRPAATEADTVAPLVFVGYGVVAPEYGWDDYKGVDVKGKAIVMLVNDPPVAGMSDPAKLDDKLFGGRAMTYYGRWTYKYEIAARKGAAAAILVHQTGPAGYPWEVVSGSWSRENFDIDTPEASSERVAVRAWVTEKVARELFTKCGADFDAAAKSAVSRDFTPLELRGGTATFRTPATPRRIESRNVVALLPGRDRQLKDELVVYTAHWDHLGIDPDREGDQIFNGALDNASGCAGLLEIAQAFASAPQRPSRSVLFLAVTAEEKGLLGSKYYASHPLYPLEQTLAVVNMDGLNPFGRTRDVSSIGLGNSTLHDVLIAQAKKQGRVVTGDSEPEKGAFYRSDHFEFAKRGVPGLHFGGSVDYLDRPPGWGQMKSDEYTARDYHKPSDELKPDWDLAGAVEDLELFLALGRELCETRQWPRWNEGAEFKAVREASLSSAR